MLDIYKTCKNLHAKLYARCITAGDAIPKVGTPMRVADFALILDKSIAYLEDTVKELKKLREKLNRPGFDFYITSAGEPVEGLYGSGNGKVGKAVNVPSLSKDPAGYQRLCEILGAPFHPTTRLHFPAVKEHITTLLAKGENLPPELAEFKQYDTIEFVVKSRDDDKLNEDADLVPGIFGEISTCRNYLRNRPRKLWLMP